MKVSSLVSATVLAIAMIDGTTAGRLPSAKSLMTQHHTIKRREEFNSYPKNGTITVTGTGRVDVFSDLTKIRFAIYKSEKCDLTKPAKDCEAAKATQRLNEVSSAVVGALTDDDDVVGVYTEGQDFSQEKEWYTDEQVEAIANAACAPCPSYLYSGEEKEYLSQYKANAEFIAIVQTSEQGRLLDLIVQSGANAITDISTYISPDVMNQANIDAVTAGAQDALDQATAVIDQLPRTNSGRCNLYRRDRNSFQR
ncbi:hypothetical protein SARC_11688 [Sphaeroforma arctica JP610]|uniref:Uncharacterized protein n=1 Tax=Sphaeroforma arctica JP610 TaxID=667725 RepID=A0A0L0FGA4_9EUKA|nr:hypothetical protein SARC_11688 [Sphaeroforma arctica JP610]KNC75795.1 hypothetical protein SARC_11688 [Sphaeroforma arctica JP610]|eukprot:XP_014149697.1 hypothetical protein SARC_11688 [Sphaeroforma arctica JP610]